jgi:thiamine biosynthesis lipoprotein
VRADRTFEVLFEKSEKTSEESDGDFDITIGPLTSAWGFGFNDREKVDQHIVDSLLPLVNYRNVKLENGRIIKTDPRIRFDFNAIAQGYAVDLVAGFLESKGVESYLIDIGGEVLGKGTKPDKSEWNVGIEKPASDANAERQVKTIVRLRDKALSTSGNYRKYYEENGVRYSHTIDPSTGFPVKHSLLSVSVLAPDCMTADAYATVMMVKGLEKSRPFLEAHPGIEAYFIYSDSTGEMKTWFTPGFSKLIEEDF